MVTEAFNTQFISEIPGRSSNLTALLVNAPRLVSQPVSYTVINTRPFDVPVATAVDFVGLIYLLILAVRPCSPSIKMFRFTEGVTVRRSDGTLRCTCGRHAS